MSLEKYYQTVDKDVWQGRIDDPDDFNAFRWHQWVESIDLNNTEIELKEDEKGICFLGFCSDQGVKRNNGRPGAAKGPISIRKELANLPIQFTQKTKLFDAGNIISPDTLLEKQQESLALAVEKILDLGLFPILLGGGHEIAFGHYSGLLKSKLKSDLDFQIGIINFDAHFDMRPYQNGGNSGTMFRQIADKSQKLGDVYSYLAVGIQKSANTVNLFQTAEQLGADYILAKDMNKSNILELLNKLNHYINQNDYIYLSICSDVFSSAIAPGVSSTQPLGIEAEIALDLIKHIIKSQKVISFDIAEVSPRFDLDNSTAKLAAIIIFAVVNTLVGEKF